jgi:hypothetical protein
LCKISISCKLCSYFISLKLMQKFTLEEPMCWLVTFQRWFTKFGFNCLGKGVHACMLWPPMTMCKFSSNVYNITSIWSVVDLVKVRTKMNYPHVSQFWWPFANGYCNYKIHLKFSYTLKMSHLEGEKVFGFT